MCKNPEPGETVVSEQAFGQQPSVGIKCNKFAREDHTHGTPPTPVIPTVPSQSPTVVTEQTFGQSSNPGISTEYSRGDHTHGTPPSLSVPSPSSTVVNEQTFGQSPSVGISTNYAREDHTHGTPSNPVPVPVYSDQTVNRALGVVYTNNNIPKLIIVYVTLRGGCAVSDIQAFADNSNPPTTPISDRIRPIGGGDFVNFVAYVGPNQNYTVQKYDGGSCEPLLTKWFELEM